MPYIKEELREPYEEHLVALERCLMGLFHENLPGDLNYVITTLIAKLMKRLPRKYHILSMLKAVLTDARDEFHDEVLRPYEIEKKKQNGGIY